MSRNQLDIYIYWNNSVENYDYLMYVYTGKFLLLMVNFDNKDIKTYKEGCEKFRS